MFHCCKFYVVFFFKQKTAYEMRIRDWSSDVCSSDLGAAAVRRRASADCAMEPISSGISSSSICTFCSPLISDSLRSAGVMVSSAISRNATRSEEHTSELQSLMRISYAVFCLQKKTNNHHSSTIFTQYNHTTKT